MTQLLCECSRLGQGDNTSYVNPKLVEALKMDIIVELACACWHTVAVVLIPPLLKGGVVRSHQLRNIQSLLLIG